MEGAVRVRVPVQVGGLVLRKAVGAGEAQPSRPRCTFAGRRDGMCEGPSRISGPIPPDPTLCPDYYRRPASGELEAGGAAAQP